MKKVKLIFSLMLLSFIAFSQAPNLINYQGVALNTNGTPIANQVINIRVSIHDATTSGTVVFSEDRTVTTDATGLFDMQIGSPGSVNTFGTINNVQWHTALKFLQIQMDPAGGINFTDMGTQQLVSVPYSLNAKNASALTPDAIVNLTNINTTGATTNQVLQYNGTNWAPANVSLTPFTLPFAGTDANTTSFKVTNTLAAGTAIHGSASTNNANSIGVFGEATFSNTQGVGVLGKASTVNATGVKGTNIQGIAIKGTNASNSSSIAAISGESTSFSGLGVEGIANGNNASSIGVSGESASGTGVKGYSSNAGSVGVYGNSLAGTGVKAISFTGNALEVDGKVKISGGNTNPSQGAVLTSDATGNAVWKNNKVGFDATSPAGPSQPLSPSVSEIFTLAENYDAGGDFYPVGTPTDPNTFIAPVAGFYHFSASGVVLISSATDNIDYSGIKILKNGALYAQEVSNQAINSISSSYSSISIVRNIHLNAGDKIKISGYQSSNTNGTLSDKSFSGHLIFAD